MAYLPRNLLQNNSLNIHQFLAGVKFFRLYVLGAVNLYGFGIIKLIKVIFSNDFKDITIIGFIYSELSILIPTT